MPQKSSQALSTTRRVIDLVVIHCSATPPEMDIGVSEIRQWHTDPNKVGGPFSDVGYHYIIRRNGTQEIGRPESRQGAHVKGHNDTSLGVCLVGGTDADDLKKADFNFTLPQIIWLSDLLNKLAEKYPDARLCGHRELDSNKACPGFDVAAFWGRDRLGKEPAHG